METNIKDSAKDLAFNNLGLTGSTLTVTSAYLDRSATYTCQFAISETAYILTKSGDRIMTKAGAFILAITTEGGD